MAQSRHPRFNFHVLYQGCFNSRVEHPEQVDSLSKQFAENMILRKTNEFNKSQGRQPITFFNPQTYVKSEEEFLKEYLQIIPTCDVTVLVTSEDTRINDEKELLLSKILQRSHQERAVLHLHLGEYHEDYILPELRLFHRVHISRKSKCSMSDILSVIWGKPVETVAQFIGLNENIESEIKFPLSHKVQNKSINTILLEYQLEKSIQDILETRAFNNWTKSYKFTNKLISDIFQSNKTTKTKLFTLFPILELKRYFIYSENEKKSLDVALNELHDGSYRWRSPLDSHLYKFHKHSTAILLARFTSNIPPENIHELMNVKEEIEESFLDVWKFQRNGLIRIWDILNKPLVFNCIIHAKDNATLNSIAFQIDSFMKTTQNTTIYIQQKDGSVIKFTPAANCKNIVFKRLSLDESFLNYIDFFGSEYFNLEYIFEGESEEFAARRRELEYFEEGEMIRQEEAQLRHQEEELHEREQELSLSTITEDNNNPNVFKMVTEIENGKLPGLEGRQHKMRMSSTFKMRELSHLKTGERTQGQVERCDTDPDSKWRMMIFPSGWSEEFKDWISAGISCDSLSDKNLRRILVQFTLEGDDEKSNNLHLLIPDEGYRASGIKRFLKSSPPDLTLSAHVQYGPVPGRVFQPARVIYDSMRKQCFTRLSAKWLVKKWKTLQCPHKMELYSPIFGRDGFVWSIVLCPNGSEQNNPGTVSVLIKLLDLPDELRRDGLRASYSILCAGQEINRQEMHFQIGLGWGAPFGQREEFRDENLRIQVLVEYPC